MSMTHLVLIILIEWMKYIHASCLEGDVVYDFFGVNSEKVVATSILLFINDS